MTKYSAKVLACGSYPSIQWQPTFLLNRPSKIKTEKKFSDDPS
jgi:hypothetical protein